MNPFMMSNIFFGPMGMSMSPMCGGGVFMPYYGQNDMLTFMNFPIFRNTASDYLLDPRLAMMQCQQQSMTGSIFGNSYLPLFNNMPGVGGIGAPWWINNNTKTETEEEKKKREAKEAEAKKPEAKKAASLKKIFDSVKKLAEDKKNRFPKIPEELIEKANKALEKETAKEQLDAMKEVLASIPAETLRKTILADDEIKKQLRAAGYNFNLEGNKYSLKDKDIDENDIVHEKSMTAIKSDIERYTHGYSEFQKLASQLNGSNASRILEFISAWNSKNNDKLFDLIASHIPEGNDSVKLSSAQMATTTIANALVIKADEYEDYPEITRLKKDLSDKITAITSPDNASIEERKAVYTKENILELSKVFNELYARLRMQEAVKIRDSIKTNDDFKVLNEVKDDIINDNMIVEETKKDLEAEGITNYPKVEELDKEPVTEEITISREIEADDLDEEFKDNAQGLADKLNEKGYLSKVSPDSKIYKTKGYDGDGSGERYFTVKDNKLVEVKKDADGKFTVPAKPKTVSAKEINNYDIAVKRIEKLLTDNAIEKFNGNYTTTSLPFPVFKATGADEYYALIDGKFGKINNCNGLQEDKTNKKIHAKGTEKTVDQIKADDLGEFKDEDVQSKEKVEKAKKEEEEKDIEEVKTKTYASYAAIDNTALKELDKITGIDNDFEETGVNGYYHCKSKNRYYKYNQTTKKLEYLEGVTKISDTGYMIKNNQWLPCTEVFDADNNAVGSEASNEAVQNYAKAFAKDLNGITSDKEYLDAKRRLNTFTSFTEPSYIVNFIKGYKAYGGFWSNSGICKQIATENGLEEGNTHTDKESKRYYIKWIAIRMKEVVNNTNFSKRSDEYALLERIANGELLEEQSYTQTGGPSAVVTTNTRKSIKATAEALDKIIDKIIEAYDEKQG